MTSQEELKKIAEKSKVVFGTNQIIKKLKQGKLTKVFIASNIPKNIEDDIRYNASISKTDIEKVNIPNDEFGIIFKRPHVLLTMGILKE